MRRQTDPIKKNTGIVALLRLTFPIVLMTALESVYSLVDGIVVAHFDGAHALAAIQIVFPLLLLLNAIGYLFSFGVQGLIHVRIKLGDRAKAEKLASSGLLATILVTGLLSVLVLLFDREVYTFLGATNEEVLHECLLYGNIVVAGSVFTTAFIYIKTVFAEAYSTQLGVTVTIISGLCNMLLDILLTGILHIGIRGAAIATVGSFAIGVMILMLYHAVKHKGAKVGFGKPACTFGDLRRFVRYGTSHMMQFVGAAIVAFVFNRQAGAEMGVLGIASVMVVMHIHMLFTAIVQGYIEGLEPEMHHRHAAHENDYLRSLIFRSILYISVFSLFVFGISQVLCHTIVHLFALEDPAFESVAENGYRLYAFGVILYGINLFVNGFLHSAELKISSAISSCCLPVLKIALFFLLPMIGQSNGVWLSIPVAELITLAVSILLLVLGYNHESLQKKKRIQKII